MGLNLFGQIPSDSERSQWTLFVLATAFVRPRGWTGRELLAGGDLRARKVLEGLSHRFRECRIATSLDGWRGLSPGLQGSISWARAISWPSTHSESPVGLVPASLLRTIFAVTASVRRTNSNSPVLLYSCSETLPDVLTALVLRCLSPHTRWAAVVHHSRQTTLGDPGGNGGLLARIAQAISFSLIRSRADLVIVANPVLATEFARRSRPTGRIDVMVNGNGIDLAEFRAAATRNSGHVREGGIFVGRLTRAKGAEDALRIWQRVIARIPSARLDMIGPEGELRVPELEQRAKSMGLATNVHFTGPVGRPELLDRLARARVMLQPSRVEGWGNSIAEALALDTPVVAWDLPEIRAVHGDRVLWASTGNLEDFSRLVVSKLCAPVASGGLSEGVRGIPDWASVAEREFAGLSHAMSCRGRYGVRTADGRFQ
jgi:glycosyltransferase involved in cell wall biosynthesis